MSKIIANPITQTNTLIALSNHIVIAAVKMVLLDNIENNGDTAFEKTLKIVKANEALTRFSMNVPKDPAKGR